jgi:hypothetical protein
MPESYFFRTLLTKSGHGFAGELFELVGQFVRAAPFE